MTAEPLHATEIRGPTEAAALGVLARAFGRPRMPWQTRADQLITERSPRGRFAHPLVLLGVQRQAGKTDDLRAVILHRAITRPGSRIYYTAQSGKYARDFWAACVAEWSASGSPLAGHVSARWSQGSEVATFPNGSTFSPFPPTRDALHGVQTDLVIVDEAWKHDAAAGAALMQAISPTQATRPDPQVIVTSAAGTADSTWWRELLELGRSGLVALLEYGIGDAGDPTDLDAVIAAHPAVGHTIDAEFIRDQAVKMTPGEFARAYGNAWTASEERSIPAELWTTRERTEPLPAGDVVIAGAVAMDGTRSAIVAVSGGVAEVIDSMPGSDWLAGRLAALAGRPDVAAVAMLRTGPDAPIADELDRLGVELLTVTTTDYATACAAWWQRLTAGVALHRPHAALDASVDAAVRRNVGDGWVWGRRASAGPIPELIAATLADWADLHRPAEQIAPEIMVYG